MQVKISEIVLDPRLQMRETMDFAAIDEYAENLFDLPPAKVVRGDDGTLWLTQGWHRYHAHQKAEQKTMECEVRDGSWLDALAEAAGGNHGHGLRRTDADKKRAVSALLAEPVWAERSDRMIAEACHVSNHFVAKIRNEVSTGSAPSSPTRTGADGKSRPAAAPKPKCPRCARCERVGDPVPKNCEMCKELRPKRPKGSSKRKGAKAGDHVPVDAFGVELPKKLRSAFCDPWIQSAIDYIGVAEVGLRKERLADGMSKRAKHYPFINAKDFIDGVGFAMNYLDQILDHLKENRPAGICPSCSGEGCSDCKMCGLVPRGIHAKLKGKKK